MLDRSQIEQVLINLLKNAGEACIEQEIPEVIMLLIMKWKSEYLCLRSLIMAVVFFPMYWIRYLFRSLLLNRQVPASGLAYANK